MSSEAENNNAGFEINFVMMIHSDEKQIVYRCAWPNPRFHCHEPFKLPITTICHTAGISE